MIFKFDWVPEAELNRRQIIRREKALTREEKLIKARRHVDRIMQILVEINGKSYHQQEVHSNTLSM